MALPVTWRRIATTLLACGGVGLGLVVAALVRGKAEAPRPERSESGAPPVERPAARSRSDAAPSAEPAPRSPPVEGATSGDATSAARPGADGRPEPLAPRPPSGVLRSGRAIRGLQYTYLWSDDALDPPIDPHDPEQAARLARMPEAVRRIVAAADEAVVHAERRRLEVEAGLGGSPLGEAVFQLAVVDSLESGFVVYPGRNLPIPASPEASLAHTLGGQKPGERNGAGWSRDAVERVRQFEFDQATRRLDLVTRAVEVARQQPPEEAHEVAALWVSQGRASYLEPAAAQELARLAEEWRRTRDEYVQRVRSLLR